MSPHAAIRAEARKRRAALLRSAARDLAGNGSLNLAELRKELEALDALAELRSLREWLLSAALPLAIALLLLLPLWWIRQPAPPIELTVRASRAVLALDGAGALELGRLPAVKSMRVEGLGTVSSDAAGVSFADKDGRGTWYLDGAASVSGVALRPLPGSSAARLVLARRGDAAEVAAEGLSLHLLASVERGASAVWSGSAGPRKAALRDANIELQSAASAPATTRAFFLLGKEPVLLPALRPRALSLREAAFDAEGRAQQPSSVLDGQLVMAGSGRKHALARGAELSLDGLDGTLLVSLEADGLHLSYAGTATAIRMGSEATLVRDLRPSLAEWLSRDPVLPLVWSSFVFLAGLAWSVRRFVRKPG